MVEVVADTVCGLDTLVPVLDGPPRRYINLDNAASTPPLLEVRRTVDRLADLYSSVHRGTGYKSQLCTHLYEAARQGVGEFVDADPDKHTVILTKSTTEGINRVARVLGREEPTVFSTIMEHHANMLPWRTLAHELHMIDVDPDGRLDLQDLENKLKAAPTQRPRLVALAGASNVTGYLAPIREAARLAHQYGAQILIDGAQLVPHEPVSMRPTSASSDDGFDFLVFSAHKLYAPYGGGALIAPRDFFHGVPDQLGGGIVEFVTLDDVLWNEVPEREEAGSPNVIGAIALHTAVSCLQTLGMAHLAERERRLTAYALQRLAEVPGLRILGPQAPSERVGVVSFLLPDVPHFLAAAVLGYEFGIGVRTGCFCAHPAIQHLLAVEPAEVQRFTEAIRQHDKRQVPGAVRMSLGLGSTRADIDELIGGLQRIVAGDYRGQYELDPRTGEYEPRNWHPAYAEAV
jgi:selenocysteine lyase/cysteine desulfurase